MTLPILTPYSDLPTSFLGVPVKFVREVGPTATLGVFHTRFRLASFGCEVVVNTTLTPIGAMFSVFRRPGDPLFTLTGRGPLSDLEAVAREAFVNLATRATEAARLVTETVSVPGAEPSKN